MARIRDRTEDFKDVVRHTAVSLGYDEVCLLSQFILSLNVFLGCFLPLKSSLENLSYWGRIFIVFCNMYMASIWKILNIVWMINNFVFWGQSTGSPVNFQEKDIYNIHMCGFACYCSNCNHHFWYLLSLNSNFPWCDCF